MKLLKYRSRDDYCLIYATAMILDTSVEQVMNIIGHYGLKEIKTIDSNGTIYEKYRRNFHIEEIQDVCLRFNKLLCAIDIYPIIEYSDTLKHAIWTEDQCIDRLYNILTDRVGLLLTEDHAVAWDGKEIYDPRGFTCELDDHVFSKLRKVYILSSI